MASKKYFERLLIVVGLFFIFFVITMVSLPLLIRVFHIDNSTREGMLFTSVYQAVMMFICPALVSSKIISRRPFQFLMLTNAPSFLSILGICFAYLISLPALNQIIYWNSVISFPESLAYWGEIFRELEDKALAATEVMLKTDSVGGLITNILVVALITAFGEEIFFRGALQTTSASSGAWHTSIWVVAIVFSAMHFQFFGFIPRLLLGAWFGYLLYWTRSLYAPIIAHFINNGVVVVCNWLAGRGVDINFDNIGVCESGFPIAAFVSALAFIVFVIYFKSFFFGTSDIKKREVVEYV